MWINKRFTFLSFFGLVALLACEHQPASVSLMLPAALQYAPSSLTVTEGTGGQSGTPSIAGSFPMQFSLVTDPFVAEGISINEQGVISAGSGLAAGTYQISVYADNAAGSTQFPDAFTIEVIRPETAPTSMRYEPASAEIVAGTTMRSAVPVLEGSMPMTFALSASPDAGDMISIDEQGVISAGSGLAAGTYTLDVTATNSLGSRRFSGIYTLAVSSEAQAPSELVYSPSQLTVDSGTGGSSVVPTINGTSPITYSLTASPDAAGGLSIGSNGVITASPELAPNTYSISVTASNAAGSRSFAQVYQLTVQESQSITFTNDIKPLITTRCASCHTTGPQTLYTNYQNAKTNINLILNRIQRQEGSAGFMPKGGTKLSDAEINLFKQWMEDGLKEN